MLTVTSVKNIQVREFIKLRDRSSERRAAGSFTVEGIRELMAALKNGWLALAVFCCNDLADEILRAEIARMCGGATWINVSPQVYEKLALRGSTEGFAAILQARSRSLQSLHLDDRPLILVVEKVEKPGNLGALLRTADAAAIDAVVVCDPLADLYNPNVIRSSLGCVFTRQVAVASTGEVMAWLRKNQIQILAATPAGDKSYIEVDFTLPTAVAVGSEAEGLSGEWLVHADMRISIPMRGQVDSLNVSVSAAVILYEAVRQRLTRG